MTEISTDQAWGTHDLMVTAAHRYCLGRRTYIVGSCVSWLMRNWELLGHDTKLKIIEETKECLEKELAGDECDIDEWNSLIRYDLEHKNQITNKGK